MLRKFAPRGDRSLGISDDPEFRGWRANMQLMQALEQRRRISGCRCARATSTARAEQPSRSAGRTRPRLPLGQCEPRKGPVEIKRTKSGVFALRCPLPRPLEEKELQLVAQFRASSGAFGECGERARNSATRWLCWRDSNCDTQRDVRYELGSDRAAR